jgi:peptide/nickel transport system ATP-binding protein
MLKVNDLKVYYSVSGGWLRAVDGVSFGLERGETLGLVGESGCGKTSVALALMRVLPQNGRIMYGEIMLDGKDITKLSEEEMRRLRWNEISMIFQAALNALDPVHRIGSQLVEVLRAHKEVTKDQAEETVTRLFGMLGIPRSRMQSYPHEFSGGMKQRAIIAMSLLCDPKVIIADEPTTALDVVVQDQILEKLKQMRKELSLSMILISHDLSIVAETCSKVAIMYGGKIVESADAGAIFKYPRHPYTIGLIRSFPSILGALRKLTSIPGSPPQLTLPIQGCVYAPRCPIAQERCRVEEPALLAVDGDHYSRCHYAKQSLIHEVNYA